MLKLHPHQVTSHSGHALCPSSDGSTGSGGEGEGLSPPSWVTFNPVTKDVTLPDLRNTASPDLSDLRDAVSSEGLLAYYIAMNITDIGTE